MNHDNAYQRALSKCLYTAALVPLAVIVAYTLYCAGTTGEWVRLLQHYLGLVFTVLLTCAGALCMRAPSLSGKWQIFCYVMTFAISLALTLVNAFSGKEVFGENFSLMIVFAYPIMACTAGVAVFNYLDGGVQLEAEIDDDLKDDK